VVVISMICTNVIIYPSRCGQLAGLPTEPASGTRTSNRGVAVTAGAPVRRSGKSACHHLIIPAHLTAAPNQRSAKNLQGQGSIIFDYEGVPCTDSYYHGTAGIAGAASSAMPGPDGRHKR